MAGADVAEAYREDGVAALEAADATARLRQEYERLGARADVLRASLTGSVPRLATLQYNEQAAAIRQAATDMETLVGQMQRGEVTGEDFQLRLDGILTSATEAFGTLRESDKIEFTLVTSALGALSTILEETRGRAAATVDELREIAGLQADLGMTTGTPLFDQGRPFMLQDYLGGRRSEAPPRAPLEGELDQDENGGGSGGGSSTESYAAAVEQIRERTEALNLEAAALIATAATGREYGDAIEYARRRAELMLAAQREGRELTPELQAEIDELARAYTDAGEAAERSAEQLQQVEDRAQRGAERVVDLFGRMAEGGESARRAVLDLIAELLRMRAIEGLSGLAKSGGGGLFGSLVSFLGFSEGGYTGDGGRLEPKGVVHGGEYVFSKRAVQTIGVARLERMHEAAKGYANGGYVGAAPVMGANSVSGKIEIGLSPDLEARVLEQAAKQSIQITREGVRQMERSLPERVLHISRNTRERF